MVYGRLIKCLTASELILNQYWTTDKLYCARWEPAVKCNHASVKAYTDSHSPWGSTELTSQRTLKGTHHRATSVDACGKRELLQLTVILIIISFPPPTHSFHSRLKTFLFCKSFPLQPFFFFFRTDYLDSPDFYCYFWASVLLFSFFLFYTFSCRFRAVDWTGSCRLSSAR